MCRREKHTRTAYSKEMICNTAIALFCFILHFPLHAQQPGDYFESITTEKFNPLVDNITDKLPPLEVLIDSAIENSPYVRYENAEAKLRAHMVKQARRNWTRYIGFEGGIHYGNQYSFYTNQVSGAIETDFSSDRYETYYKIGMFLRLPLYDIIDKQNNVHIAKREAEKSILRKEQIVKQSKQEVIITYEDLVLRQKLLKLVNEAQITTSLQVEMAEKEFLNGNIPISELSRLTEIHSKNISEFVKQSSLFYQQYLILEEMVGMKFNLLNEIY